MADENIVPLDEAMRVAMKGKAARDAIGAEWAASLLTNSRGAVLGCMANVAVALRGAPELRGMLAFNEFTNTVTVSRRLPWMKGDPEPDSPWAAYDDLCLLQWCQERSIGVEMGAIVEGVSLVARDRVYHPVREYLGGLAWDGEERLERWLVTHFGCDAGDERHRDWLAAVGLKWPVSAVARVMQPGCKADCLPVFEGEQGVGKSTALKLMGGRWFTDEVAEIGSKDAAMQLRGAWIIEHAELDAIGRADAARFKAFASRTADRFRPPYGRRVEEVPRQCVFAGTVNPEGGYLRDATGARRFWPVLCGKIDLGAIERDRDQLWAEAHHRWAEHEPWWLDGEVAETAQEEQAGRYVGDAWAETVADKIGVLHEVTIPELMGLMGLDITRRDQKASNRVAQILTSFGWRKVRLRDTQTRTRKWAYRSPDFNELGLGPSML